MSNKHYSSTINPQAAVQDYLDDLLQKLPATSPLDELREEDERREAVEAAEKIKSRQKAKKKSVASQPKVTHESAYTTGSTHVSVGYSAGRETSLAAQRLEKKRARDRASFRDFREPLSITPPSLIKALPQIEQPITPVPEVVVSAPSAAITQTNIKEQDQTLAQPAEAPIPQAKIDLPRETKPRQSPSDEISQPETLTQQTEQQDDKILTKGEGYLNSWLDNGRPSWAQGRFECLIFTVAGLKLAVPLVSLGAIHRMDRELTPLVGRPNWFLGLLPVGEKNIRVVDSALWIMPERYTASVKDAYKFVIRLDNSEWGMACDSVAQSFSISPEEVRWRTDRGKRPWLAGTVIDHMCALMDVAAVSHLLDGAEKTNFSPI